MSELLLTSIYYFSVCTHNLRFKFAGTKLDRIFGYNHDNRASHIFLMMVLRTVLNQLAVRKMVKAGQRLTAYITHVPLEAKKKKTILVNWE